MGNAAPLGLPARPPTLNSAIERMASASGGDTIDWGAAGPGLSPLDSPTGLFQTASAGFGQMPKRLTFCVAQLESGVLQ